MLTFKIGFLLVRLRYFVAPRYCHVSRQCRDGSYGDGDAGDVHYENYDCGRG